MFDRYQKYEDAISDFSEAIKIDSKNPVYYHNRGCCYRNMGELEKSLKDFDFAVRLDDRNPIIY